MSSVALRAWVTSPLIDTPAIGAPQQRAIRRFILVDFITHIGAIAMCLFFTDYVATTYIPIIPGVMVWTILAQLLALWLHRQRHFQASILLTFIGRVVGLSALVFLTGTFESTLWPHLLVPLMLISFILTWRAMLTLIIVYTAFWTAIAFTASVAVEVGSIAILFGAATLIIYALVMFKARIEQQADLQKIADDYRNLQAELAAIAKKHTTADAKVHALQQATLDLQHDLRNPLSSILLRVSTLERFRDRMTDAQFKKSFGDIRSAINEMNLALIEVVDPFADSSNSDR